VSVVLDPVIVGARFGLIMALAALALVVLERRRGIVTRFLHEDSTALNLAVARVVIMSAMLWDTRLGRLLDFASLDPALMAAPHGWGLLAPHVPLDAPIVMAAYLVLVIAATLGLVGLAGRAMCGVSAATALYLHTIPQLFGKVNHTANHLILFSVLLAVAPSCDALAIDAVRTAVRDADRGFVRRMAPSRAYALALQAMMVYIGLAYFFPGVWKVARAGSRWFSGDNMRLLILSKLQEFPISPLQHWVVGQSWLLALMPVVTVVFEIGFVFAILDRRARPATALVGVGFHEATGAVMGIWFTALQASYVVFIDWTGCLQWVASRRRIEPITLRYRGDSPQARRLVGVVVACDWLDLVRPVAVAGDPPVAPNASRGPSWAIVDPNGTVISDPDAVAAAVAGRIPLLWPLGRVLGAHAVRSLAIRSGPDTARHHVALAVTPPASDPSPLPVPPFTHDVSPALRYATLGLVGSFALAGVAHAVRTWPIACYPTFDVVEPPFSRLLAVVAVDRSGGTHSWTLSFDPVMGRRLGTDRWRGLIATVLNTDQPFDSARARALLETWRPPHTAPELRTVTFYGDTYPLGRDGPRVLLDRREIGTLTIAAHP
jgi:Vitamin K-dependent gamma-carboxylase